MNNYGYKPLDKRARLKGKKMKKLIAGIILSSLFSIAYGSTIETVKGNICIDTNSTQDPISMFISVFNYPSTESLENKVKNEIAEKCIENNMNVEIHAFDSIEIERNSDFQELNCKFGTFKVDYSCVE